jgi:hypothetical protein
MEKKQEYAMLQLPKRTHALLKEYCKQHGFIMSVFVSNLINKTIKDKK